MLRKNCSYIQRSFTKERIYVWRHLDMRKTTSTGGPLCQSLKKYKCKWCLVVIELICSKVKCIRYFRRRGINLGNYTFATRFDTSHVLVELEVPVGRPYCYYKRFIVPRPRNWSYANSDYLGEGQNDNGIVRPNDWQLNLTPPTSWFL